MPLGEKMIWDFLMNKIGNPYGVAGLMGNLYAESALNPAKLERTAEKKLGVSSAEYTARVDDGRYDAEHFAHDGAGYGLAQWTYHARKAALLCYAKECGVSIGSLAMQLEYLWKELQGYKTVLKVLRAAVSVREASDMVMTRYERPKNQSESARSKRQRYGQKYFDAYAGKGVENVSYNPQAVLSAALNEVGYLEKATIAQLDDKTANAGNKNYTKYARDLYNAKYFNGNKQGAAWCAVFVAWCFFKAFGKDAALTLLCQPEKDNCGAGCGYIVRYFKAKKQWHTSSPQPGDVIVFYDTKMSGFQHTGLVCAVDSDYVYTVEGNTSSESGVIPNGGAVARKKYRHSYARIAGYGRPNWGVSASGSAGGGNDSADFASTSSGAAADAGKQVVVTASSVNIRTGNGKQYTRLTAVPQGTALKWVATAENGWHAVKYKKQIAWLDGQFAQVRG